MIYNEEVWAAVRRGERGEFVDVCTISGCLDYSRRKAQEVDNTAPTWAAAAPVIRFGKFSLVELVCRE